MYDKKDDIVLVSKYHIDNSGYRSDHHSKGSIRSTELRRSNCDLAGTEIVRITEITKNDRSY